MCRTVFIAFRLKFKIFYENIMNHKTDGKIIQTNDEIPIVDFTSSKPGCFSGNNNVKNVLYVCENRNTTHYFFLSINKNAR